MDWDRFRPSRGINGQKKGLTYRGGQENSGPNGPRTGTTFSASETVTFGHFATSDVVEPLKIQHSKIVWGRKYRPLNAEAPRLRYIKGDFPLHQFDRVNNRTRVSDAHKCKGAIAANRLNQGYDYQIILSRVDGEVEALLRDDLHSDDLSGGSVCIQGSTAVVAVYHSGLLPFAGGKESHQPTKAHTGGALVAHRMKCQSHRHSHR